MPELSDNQQAILTLVSTIFIAVGSASIPAGAPWYAVLSLEMIGVIGLTVKEFLGSKPSSTSLQVGDISANTTTISTKATVVTLPPLPQGFDLGAAKAEGLIVYENPQGNIVINDPSAEAAYKWQDVFGHAANQPDLSTYVRL